MKRARLIARLDVKGENLIKGIHLEGLRKLGAPNDFARRYYEAGIDELLYIDCVASLYGRNNLHGIVEQAAHDIFVPITVGGGVRSVDDARTLLRAGADKVAVNTAAVGRPALLCELAEEFGSQCVVLSVQAKSRPEGGWEAYTDTGRERSGRDAVEWVQEGLGLGAGEVLLTSVDREGTRKGMDVELISAAGAGVSVPVIASGGIGKPDHAVQAAQAGADGVTAADFLHYERGQVADLRAGLRDAGIGGEMSDLTVTIVDYGAGNLLSVARAVEKVGAHPLVTADPAVLLDASRVILPGVGAFPRAMAALSERGLIEPLREYGRSGRPLMGICLGMQLLMTSSREFGETEGLGLIAGSVERIPDTSEDGEPLKVPHVGWNQLRPPAPAVRSPSSPALESALPLASSRPLGSSLPPTPSPGQSTASPALPAYGSLPIGESVYFVHSFRALPSDPGNLAAECEYGGHRIAAAVAHGAVSGCQFHPEKSGPAGLSILAAFALGDAAI